MPPNVGVKNESSVCRRLKLDSTFTGTVATPVEDAVREMVILEPAVVSRQVPRLLTLWWRYVNSKYKIKNVWLAETYVMFTKMKPT
jgi:hypothetical protein